MEKVREGEDEWDEGKEETVVAIRHLKDLQKHPGWAILMNIVERNIHDRTDKIVLAPRGKNMSEFEEEFCKGEITAYRTFKELAPLIVQSEEYARAEDTTNGD